MLQREPFPQPLAFGKLQARDSGWHIAVWDAATQETNSKSEKLFLICWPTLNAKNANSGK
jgi:hypothetical protein